jgi:hypothetical protein
MLLKRKDKGVVENYESYFAFPLLRQKVFNGPVPRGVTSDEWRAGKAEEQWRETCKVAKAEKWAGRDPSRSLS